MAVAKLNLMEIEFPQSQSGEVLKTFIDLDDFHPEPASKFTDSVHGLSVLNRENPYADLITRMEEARDKYGVSLECVDCKPRDMNIIQADTFFCDVLEKAETIEKVRKELNEMVEENDTTMKQLQFMIHSEIDFDKLFAVKYLQVRIGSIPTENIDKLQYYKAQEFLFSVLHRGNKITYCLYVTTQNKAPEIDNIFSSLYFERMIIPEFVHGKPEDALDSLKEENETALHHLDELHTRAKALYQDNIAQLQEFYSSAIKLNEIYEAQKYVVVFGNTCGLYGFVEKKKAEEVKQKFEKIDDVYVDIKSATDDSRLTPPTKLISNWFSKPFRMFVEMYGVPSYTDFDPTNFVAISYVLLFGVMFGDIGQGLVLSLVGYIAYKWKGLELGAVGVRLGFSSALFGIVYGSFFGNEEVFTPIFHTMDPDNTMTLLGVAIGIGVVLIIIAMLFNIATRIKMKDWGEMIFSHNGIAGLVFYVSVLTFACNSLLNLGLPVTGGLFKLVCMVLPVIMIFFKEPLSNKIAGKEMFPHGVGAFVTESFFELFEVMLTFIANTMSFLRVGGFVLSHAGMMLVVYTLAGMFGPVGHYVTLVLGNIFVMCLEGLIVGIQVLRLEFYEMFSRYYDGKGQKFKSIKER